MIGRRTRSYISIWAAASVAALFTGGAGAFADPGHRVVGRIAEIHLANSRALEEVRKILPPQETLADASVWADTIKSFAYEDADTQPFRLAHPAQDVYHFTNIPFQASKYDAGAFGAHWIDIVRMTRECVRVLRGSSQLFTRREALRLLAHFLADIHQPLHVGAGFVSAEGPLRFLSPDGPTGWRSTLGGNALRYGPNDNFNLHTYWDTHVVNLAMQRDDVPTYSARLVKELGVLPTWRNAGDPDSWPALWATESLVLSQEGYAGIKITTYLGPDAERGPAHRWRIEQPANYDDMAKARVRVQLAKGGYRLAATLKAIWPDSKP
jgi:S1/P1 Nuclease